MDKPPRHRQPWTTEDCMQAGELLRQGHTNRQIAADLGRTGDTVAAMLYKLGLNRGSTHCLYCAAFLDQPETGRRRRYCDNECRTAMEKTQRLAVREAALETAQLCAYCGAEIPMDRRRRSPLVLYCRRTCAQDAWYARKCAEAGRVPVKHGPHAR